VGGGRVGMNVLDRWGECGKWELSAAVTVSSWMLNVGELGWVGRAAVSIYMVSECWCVCACAYVLGNMVRAITSSMVRKCVLCVLCVCVFVFCRVELG
jgi:hypothetical protein